MNFRVKLSRPIHIQTMLLESSFNSMYLLICPNLYNVDLYDNIVGRLINILFFW